MNSAQQAGNEAIDRAMRHASPEWVACAEAAVRNCAENFNEFSSDDVWSALATMHQTTHEPRALGGIMRRAVKSGICFRTDTYRPSVREQCHGRPVMVYRGRK